MRLLTAALLLATAAHAQPPHDLAGLDINLQIEKVEGPAAASQPNQGAIVRRIGLHGQWTSTGVGGPNHRDTRGSSQWRHQGPQTLIETASDGSRLTYRFDTPDSGQWTWQVGADAAAMLSGSFTTAPSAPTAQQQLAPATNAGLHVPLIIKAATSKVVPRDRFPTAGLVLQTYAADGTLVFQGFGPGTLNSRGTYTFKRVSANTAVEETVQTSDFFTYPYTMVYTFKTADSGVWYQNFGDGLIRFSGTFDTFPASPSPGLAR